MKYRIVYEKTPRNYSAYSPDLPGCVAVGDTLDECRLSMREAIDFHLEGMQLDGDPMPPRPTGFVEILDFPPQRPWRRKPTARKGRARAKATAR